MSGYSGETEGSVRETGSFGPFEEVVMITDAEFRTIKSKKNNEKYELLHIEMQPEAMNRSVLNFDTFIYEDEHGDDGKISKRGNLWLIAKIFKDAATDYSVSFDCPECQGRIEKFSRTAIRENDEKLECPLCNMELNFRSFNRLKIKVKYGFEENQLLTKSLMVFAAKSPKGFLKVYGHCAADADVDEQDMVKQDAVFQRNSDHEYAAKKKVQAGISIAGGGHNEKKEGDLF